MRVNETEATNDFPLLSEEGEDSLDSDLFLTVQALISKHDRDEYGS